MLIQAWLWYWEQIDDQGKQEVAQLGDYFYFLITAILCITLLLYYYYANLEQNTLFPRYFYPNKTGDQT